LAACPSAASCWRRMKPTCCCSHHCAPCGACGRASRGATERLACKTDRIWLHELGHGPPSVPGPPSAAYGRPPGVFAPGVPAVPGLARDLAVRQRSQAHSHRLTDHWQRRLASSCYGFPNAHRNSIRWIRYRDKARKPSAPTNNTHRSMNKQPISFTLWLA
jgi:hypothetical protein